MSKRIVGSRIPLPSIALCATLALGCGEGGGSNDPDGGGTNDPPSFATYEGTWLAGLCTALGGDSGRMRLVVDVDGSDVSYGQLLVRYTGAGCTGTGTTTGDPSPLGTIAFASSHAGSGVSFSRGVWSPPGQSPTNVVWALETPSRLCILADTEPTAFPNARSVAAYLDVLGDELCYTRE